MNDELIAVTYSVRGSLEQAPARIEALGLEQTVELPRQALPRGFDEASILPRVLTPPEHDARGYRVTLGYPPATAGECPLQLLNLLFGNSSLHDDIVLEEITFPASLDPVLPGPAFGIEGLRSLTGAWGRPLACTALKPMGLAPEDLAELAGRLAAAGIDLVKDDHGLADQAFCPFEQRVRRCAQAVSEANARHGGRTLYVPNLLAVGESLEKQIDLCRRLDIRAVMIEPMLSGPALMPELARRRELAILAHPALAGGRGLAPSGPAGPGLPGLRRRRGDLSPSRRTLRLDSGYLPSHRRTTPGHGPGA
ncbi:MAG: RuBisCO large subunit C-terminal-like domain-containing protein [Acidobacteriota bacterium]|nr:RuBisCO large subunit C-terminal-like domain-containing protein [Acidobacteriota bacterium]